MRTRRLLVLGASVLLAAGGLVASGPAGATVRTLSNNTPITIPAGAPETTSGNASLYPSTVTVSGLGPITDADVTVKGLTHTHPDDLDILLVSPSGTGVALMSDVGGSNDISNYRYTFDDEASSAMSDSLNVGLVYKPTNSETPDTWSGFPSTPASALSAFDGENPNGVWSLRIVDDTGGDFGSSTGWELKLTTADDVALIVPGNTSADAGPASLYPLNIPVSGKPGKIKDLNVKLTGVTHTNPDDLDILLVAPTGQGVLLMSDSCGTSDIGGYRWTFDDEAAATMTDSTLSGCNPFVVRPSNFGASADGFPAPAPTGPYQTVLSGFDGLPANGTWKLFVTDDASSDGGYIKSAELQFTVTPPNTIVTARPKAKTKSRSATIRFKSSLAGSTFTCKVDKKPVRACKSPLKLTKLKVGKHTVLIRAKTVAGGADPTPAKVTWTVKR